MFVSLSVILYLRLRSQGLKLSCFQFSIMYNCSMLLIAKLLCIFLLLLQNAESQTPTWSTSPDFRANTYTLFATLLGPAASGLSSSIAFSSAFNSEPYMVFGVKKYRGDDYLLQEYFRIKVDTIDSSGMLLIYEITGVTNIWLFDISYLAIIPQYSLSLITFYGVPLNFASTLTNITTPSSQLETYTNTIDYSDQSFFSVNNNLPDLSNPTNLRIVLFLTALGITSVSNSSVTIDFQTSIIDATHYELKATVGYNVSIAYIQFSILIFNQGQYNILNNKYLTTEEWSLTNTSIASNIPLDSLLKKNFIMGLKQFSSKSGQCVLQYQWDYVNYNNGTNTIPGVQIYSSIPHNVSACGMSTSISSLLYFMTWTCPLAYPFFNLLTRTCYACPINNCQTCANQTACSVCSPGYLKINNLCFQCPISCSCGGYTLPKKANGDCSTQCGDGYLIFPYETCDDGNTNEGDGCSSSCTIEQYSVCFSEPSICYLNRNLEIVLSRIEVSPTVCNTITFTFAFFPSLPVLQRGSVNWVGLISTSHSTLTQIGSPVFANGKVSLVFHYSQTLQRKNVSFTVNPSSLLSSAYFSQSHSTSLQVNVVPNNNIAAVFCDKSICSGKTDSQAFGIATSTIAYLGLLFSIFSCKIVGLEMFGVLQVAYFSLSDYDYVNPILASMLSRRQVNGLNLAASPSDYGTLSDRVVANGVNSELFLSNFNLMFLFTFIIAIVGLVIYIVTYYINQQEAEQLNQQLHDQSSEEKGRVGQPEPDMESRGQVWHRWSKILLKEVLLTFVIFNLFNFSFAAGIQIKYISQVDSFSIVCLLIALALTVAVAIGQVVADKPQFGEFKGKFGEESKQSQYMLVTIGYRFLLGFLMALLNEWILSGVVFVLVSAAFLTYICYCDPFLEPLHNRRSKAVHAVHVLILFVNLYYRLEANYSEVQSNSLLLPAYIQITAVALVIFTSTLFLAYEAYVKIRDAWRAKTQEKLAEHTIENEREEVKAIPSQDIETLHDISQ